METEYRVLALDHAERRCLYPAWALVSESPNAIRLQLTERRDWQCLAIDTTVLPRGPELEALVAIVPEKIVVYLLLQDEGGEEGYKQELARYDNLPGKHCQVYRTGRTHFPGKLADIVQEPSPSAQEETSRARLAERRSAPKRQKPVLGDDLWEKYRKAL